MSIAIKSGAKVIYQWERGVALTASTPCDILRVSREDDRVTDDLYPVISGSTGTALIPDRMLTESGYLHISRIDHADGSERVLETVRILVRHAAKPQNTASSTKEIVDMQALRMQMAALERAAREGKFDGKDGITPHIGENGNWFAGNFDLGVRAQGEKGDKGDPGDAPYVGANGNWFVGDFDTGVKAKSEDVSLYADDLYTSGVLVTDDLESFVMTGTTSDTGTPRIVTSPGVVYIKGVRRWLNTAGKTFHVPEAERVLAQYIRLNEKTGEIGYSIWHDVTINGDIDNGGEIVDQFTGEVIPKRSGGYYDVILCIVTIPAGATEVTPDMIRDLRGDERYCGFVRSKVDGGAKALTEHNVSETAHSDIRLLLTDLTERLNAIADSDDTTLDQLSEIVAYIKANKTLIESVTTSKVNVADIVDNLTTNASDQPLSAKMGVELRRLISTVENRANNAMSDAADAMNRASYAESMASSATQRASSAEQVASAAEQMASDALRAANAAQPAGDYITKDDLSGMVEDAVSDAVGDLVGEAVEDLVGGSLEDIVTDIVEDVISGEKDAFSETGEVVELAVEEGTPLSVVSKIHRDETWGLSDKLVLHQVSGSNFADLSAYLGGAGTVFEQNGITATINADSTVTIAGTNTLDGWNYIISKSYWSGEHSEKVYPAGTYTIPKGFMMAFRAARHPSNTEIAGATGSLSGTVTIPESFRIAQIRYAVKANTTVDLTLPLGMFRGEAVPETEFAYNGHMHMVTFDRQVYEGEFNWSTGELKDADGNTVAYYDSRDIVSLPGTNYFWTGFGENTVSNVSKDLEKVVIQLNETAPDETIPSICDFQYRPMTPYATYCLHSEKVLNGSAFFGHEIPLITTKGTISVVNAQGEVITEKYVDALINWQGVSDTLTNKGIHKVWSDRFYFTKEPVAQEDFTYDGGVANSLYTFEFTEEDFQNIGLPAKLDNIPIVSPCFYTEADAADKLNQRLWGGSRFPATFSWDEASGKYIFKVRGLYIGRIMYQLQNYTKGYLHYQLETPYDNAATFAMGVSSGDKVTFTVDDSDWKTYAEAGLYGSAIADGVDAAPNVAVLVPRNATDACDGMINAARMLNADEAAGGDATVQGYSWIGAGDGTTDYTAKIQSKLDELHTVSNGGTIHLGPGTYPISKSLIVYYNTQIIGEGHTVIEQRSDNTHAVIWNGSKIRMCDLTIKLAGACTELTACIFANSYNTESGNRDERYPENTSVQNCSTSNVTLIGTYGFSRDDEGYSYLSEAALAYRGVGVYGRDMYFNYYDCDGLTCRGLYAGISGVGSANIYRVYVTNTRFPVRAGGSNNLYSLVAHSYHANGRDGIIVGAEYAFYAEESQAANVEVRFYDAQFSKGVLYFDGLSNRNYYEAYSADSGIVTGINTYWETGHRQVTDYGRGNVNRNAYKECYTGVGPSLYNLQGFPIWNTQFNPSVHNALSGAGIWGVITSNKGWTSRGINLSDVCRYPKDTFTTGNVMAYALCESSPSEDSPIEIIIDISDRPVTNHNSYWIQFDHRFVAEDYTVSFDTTNDGVFNHNAGQVTGNNEVVSYHLSYQNPSLMIYRIKISITKALQIPEYTYMTEGFDRDTIDYNPEGKIGIVNIGMSSNEAYGRAFLGECGGGLYGNVDMHQNALKNLPAPTEDGDAVSKAYLEQRLAELEALIGKG